MPKTNKILTDLREEILALKKWMEKDPPLDTMDQMLIENNIQMLQMTYTSWKARNGLRRMEEK